MPNLDASTSARVQAWLEGPYDAATKAEIRRLLDAGDFTALTDAFYRDLEFGTGGLRGIMGVGTNRVNRYTLGAATQGLSTYLRKQYGDAPISVVIAHDSRHNGNAFANVVADVFSANGIKVWFFEGMRPTPELSFAIRHLGCQSGVMLTASHNPKEYNGYKAYWNDGGQIIAPHDRNIIGEVQAIRTVDEVKWTRDPALVLPVPAEVDAAYLAALKAESLSPEIIERQHDLRIVFSPLHGTGVMVPEALHAFGFTDVRMVSSQAVPDGDFPTVVYPNPEEHEALTLALQQAETEAADLVMATDPDADRVGVAVRGPDGRFLLLNGNQTASLLFEYVLSVRKATGRLPENGYVVKTIVTSHLLDAIAAHHGVPCLNVLTGFKFIGALMTERQGKGRFLVGGEESYGYLVGEHARDKDAVVSCCLIAEMTAYWKDQGRSPFDVLLDLYIRHGFYREKLVSLTKTGKAGAEEIAALMAKLRATPPATLGGSRVVLLRDYTERRERNLAAGTETPIALPKSDVLQFVTEDGSIISARPSGTEPKIKFYCSVKGGLPSRADYARVAAELDAKTEAILRDLQD